MVGPPMPENRQAVCAAVGRPTGVLLAPVLLRQGARVRRTTPMLPEAAGDRSGREGAAGGQAPLRLRGRQPTGSTCGPLNMVGALAGRPS